MSQFVTPSIERTESPNDVGSAADSLFLKVHQIAFRVAESVLALPENPSARLKALLCDPEFYRASKGNDTEDAMRYSYLQNLGEIPDAVKLQELQAFHSTFEGIRDDGVLGVRKWLSSAAPNIRFSNRAIYELRREAAKCFEFIGSDQGEDADVSKVLRTVAGCLWFYGERATQPGVSAGRNLSGDMLLARAMLYGLSYPLVEDVIDRPDRYGREHIDRLGVAVSHFLEFGSFPEFTGPDAARLNGLARSVERIAALGGLTTDFEARAALLALHRVQIMDIELMNSESPHPTEALAMMSMKAALTRVAAGLLMDVPFSSAEIEEHVGQGLINQLHDDFCDLSDDLQTGVPTLLTRDASGKSILGCSGVSTLMRLYASELERTDGEERIRLRLARLSFILGGESYSPGNTINLATTLANCSDRAREAFVHILETAQLGEGRVVDLEKKKLGELRTQHKDHVAQVREFKETWKSVQSAVRTELPHVVERMQPLLGVSGKHSPHFDLNAALNYALVDPGKNFRSLLALLTLKAFNIDGAMLDVVPLFSAIELLQTASLIIDDLPQQDDASLRRGQETLHLKYGEPTAQLTALALMNQAQREILRLSETFGLQVALNVSDCLSRNVIRLSDGQLADLELRDRVCENDTPLQPRELLRVHLGKTGAGMRAPISAAGAIVCRDNDRVAPEIAKLEKFAAVLGLIYQLTDDLLEHVSSAETGKSSSHELNQASISFGYGRRADMLSVLEASALRILNSVKFENTSAKAQFVLLLETVILRNK